MGPGFDSQLNGISQFKLRPCTMGYYFTTTFHTTGTTNSLMSLGGITCYSKGAIQARSQIPELGGPRSLACSL